MQRKHRILYINCGQVKSSNVISVSSLHTQSMFLSATEDRVSILGFNEISFTFLIINNDTNL